MFLTHNVCMYVCTPPYQVRKCCIVSTLSALPPFSLIINLLHTHILTTSATQLHPPTSHTKHGVKKSSTTFLYLYAKAPPPPPLPRRLILSQFSCSQLISPLSSAHNNLIPLIPFHSSLAHYPAQSPHAPTTPIYSSLSQRRVVSRLAPRRKRSHRHNKHTPCHTSSVLLPSDPHSTST